MQAPENFITQEYTPASDIWAIGILLHEILVGVSESDLPLPSTDYDELQELAKNKKLIPSIFPHGSVPEIFRQVCALCFEQDPARRPTAKTLLTLLKEKGSDDADHDHE